MKSIATLLLLLSACATTRGAGSVPALSSGALDCPEDKIEVLEVANDGLTRLAVGCGKQAIYTRAFSEEWRSMGDLRGQAAADLRCAPEQTGLKAETGTRWVARACGQRAIYVYTNEPSGPRWQQESVGADAPSEASRNQNR